MLLSGRIPSLYPFVDGHLGYFRLLATTDTFTEVSESLSPILLHVMLLACQIISLPFCELSVTVAPITLE